MAQPLRFQHFEILTKPDGSPYLLGKGSMGLTYKAFDRNLLSLVVVKVIAPGQMDRPTARQRFLVEAQSMARIRHPNVADVFFFGDSPQGVFYAMEFCNGPTVQEYVEEAGPMNPVEVLVLGLQAAQALEAVESHRLIHRDIKPSNLILINDLQGRSQLKLIDFGLAREVLGPPGVSQHGFVGTPTFASPEQLLEQDHLDIRSDIYSLGVTLWFMLTGRAPFNGSQFEVMFHHVNTPPPADRLPSLAGPARSLLLRMLGKSPEDRYPNAHALAEAFREALKASGAGDATAVKLKLKPREEEGSVLGMSSFEILAQAEESDVTGKIFKARDAHANRIVALKYLHPSIAAREEVLARIQRMALSLRELSHPNLIGVLGFEKSGEEAKIISEWVAGPSLLALLKARGHLGLQEAAPLLGQLASALDFASARGVRSVETDLHQIRLVAPGLGEDPTLWSARLRRPAAEWGDAEVKINPLRISPAAQDYPTLHGSAAAGEPESLSGVFQQLAYRLLGGAAGSSQTRMGTGYISIPSLGAEANDVLESFGMPGGTRRGPQTCVELVQELCRAEGLAEVVVYQPPPETENDADLTRDAVASNPVPSAGPVVSFATKGRAPLPSGYNVRPGPGTKSAAGTAAGTHGRAGTGAGSSGRSHVGAMYSSRHREAGSGALTEGGGSRAGGRGQRAEYLEQTRAVLDEERAALARAREEFLRQERERALRAEQERQKLEEERQKLDEKGSEVEARRREQERLEQEMRLRAQLEFQKFEEERRQRAAELARQREEMELSLREREEQALLREQMGFRKIREERERLLRLQQELDEGHSPGRDEREEQLRNQVAQLEAERASLAAQQAELDRSLQEQSAEIARLREQFQQAEQELENRYRKLAEEESAAEARRQQEMESERQRLAQERQQLERHHAELQETRRAGTEAAEAALRQQQLDSEAALQQLARQEAEWKRDQEQLEIQRAGREQALAEGLAAARAELERERAQLAQAAGEVHQANLAELEQEREALAGQRAQLAAREKEIAEEVGRKNEEITRWLAQQQEALEGERAAVAAERARLEAEYQKLTEQTGKEKAAFLSEQAERQQIAEEEHRRRMQERAAEVAAMEEEERQRLETLRQEIAAEEARLQQQRQEVFSQERLMARMDQEAGFADQLTREEFEAEQKQLETQRQEIAAQLETLQKARRKRMVTIVTGIAVGVVAASGAGWYIKGRLIDPAELKGQEAWVQYDRERSATLGARDWPAVLNWCVQTEERFQKQEQDPVIRKFYEGKRGGVMADAGTAVQGLLEEMSRGWSPPPASTPEFQKLRQNLHVITGWEGLPEDRWLVLAKLEIPFLTQEKNAAAALQTYQDTVRKNAGYVPALRGELAAVIEGLLRDYLEDHALENRNGIFVQLGQLPVESRNSVPRLWLLLYLLKAEEARTARVQANNVTIALDALNAPGSSPETREFYDRDPEWAAILRPEVDRILEGLKAHPEVTRRMEEVLRTTAEQWKTDAPYLLLAESAELTQMKLDYYLAAEKISGNPAARSRIAGYFLQQAAAMNQAGNVQEAQRLVQEGMTRLRESAATGDAEAMFLLSDALRLGTGGTKNLEQAIQWAGKARESGHPEADYLLGICYLAKGESPPEVSLLKLAEKSLLTAGNRSTSLNAGKAWYRLAYTYTLLQDPGKTVEALEKGAASNDPDSLMMLGQYRMMGPPWFVSGNLTLGRDLLTKAARRAHPEALKILRDKAPQWKKSGLPADREWVTANQDLLEEGPR